MTVYQCQGHFHQPEWQSILHAQIVIARLDLICNKHVLNTLQDENIPGFLFSNLSRNGQTHRIKNFKLRLLNLVIHV